MRGRENEKNRGGEKHDINKKIKDTKEPFDRLHDRFIIS